MSLHPLCVLSSKHSDLEEDERRLQKAIEVCALQRYFSFHWILLQSAFIELGHLLTFSLICLICAAGLRFFRDLDIFPNGLETQIGEKGISLSVRCFFCWTPRVYAKNTKFARLLILSIFPSYCCAGWPACSNQFSSSGLFRCWYVVQCSLSCFGWFPWWMVFNRRCVPTRRSFKRYCLPSFCLIAAHSILYFMLFALMHYLTLFVRSYSVCSLLSAVDPAVAKHLFEECICGALSSKVLLSFPVLSLLPYSMSCGFSCADRHPGDSSNPVCSALTRTSRCTAAAIAIERWWLHRCAGYYILN